MEILKDHHQREDYLELLELTVIFFGGMKLEEYSDTES